MRADVLRAAVLSGGAFGDARSSSAEDCAGNSKPDAVGAGGGGIPPTNGAYPAAGATNRSVEKWASRRAHNPEIAGSNPAAATKPFPTVLFWRALVVVGALISIAGAGL